VPDNKPIDPIVNTPSTTFPTNPPKKNPKFVFVTGGVISGLGKGISTASTSLLVKDLGFKVSVIKVDMYLNIDAGTINPLEHGEVFVTQDGIETDQDLGNYERYLDQELSRLNYMTMGQVYFDVITKERHFGYAGEDVEGHIHIPEEIIRRLYEVAEKDDADIVFVEVGGTVGEYQNVMFFETIRRMKQSNPTDVSIIHLVYILKPPFLGELKSKPAQSSIYELYKLGLQPDFVICRAEVEVDEEKRGRIASNTGIRADHIIAAPDVDTVYRIPLLFRQQGLDTKLLDILGLAPKKKPSLAWANFVRSLDALKGKVKIAITGKYFNFGESVLEDAYICVIEAVKHAAWRHGTEVEIQWFDVERFENPKERKKIEKELEEFDGIIVPQGWGSRGVEGKILAVEYARTRKVPYLGLCFGMQMGVIEFSRNVLGLEGANSTEANPDTKYPVVHIMPEQEKYLKEKEYGGTIRLGNWPCKLREGSILEEIYRKYTPDYVDVDGIVQERHRHRYEVNEEFKAKLEEAGLIISGTSPDGKLAEAIELPKDIHPFFVASQFHPEYKSRPLKPHPMFMGFIAAAISEK
jgi:CTP synthase